MAPWTSANPHLQALLGEVIDPLELSEAKSAAARAVSLEDFFAATSARGVANNRAHDLFGASPLCGPDHMARIMLGRVEELALKDAAQVASWCRDGDFADTPSGAFYALMDIELPDLAAFDRTVERMVRLLLPNLETPTDSIAGLARPLYWGYMLDACAPVYDDSGAPRYLCDTNPALWSAIIQHAFDLGTGPDSPVGFVNHWSELGAAQAEEASPFRQAIVDKAGFACAAIYDALCAERSMSQQLTVSAGAVATSRRRRQL